MSQPLSARQQQAYDLHQRMSLRDVARAMGLSLDAVKTHVKRANRKMAEHENSRISSCATGTP